MARGDILAVVGAAYGSEGKGVMVNHVANRYDVHCRVGGPNAGHSFYHNNVLYKMQVIPCGWTNPNAMLYLGRGMLVDGRHLVHELEMIEKVDPSILLRFRVDAKAGVLDDRHRSIEGGVEGEIHQRIGSTGEGVGAARVARVNRDRRMSGFFGDHADQYMASHGRWSLRDFLTDNTPEQLYQLHAKGTHILLEGTQGAALSLIHGPWPYVTSADTNAAQMAADLGLAPRLVNRTVLVARTFPIRVAGNSGPLKGELSWEEMSERMGTKVEERTTVTKKIRRVGQWDDDLFKLAVTLNRPTSVALMFTDYLEKDIAGSVDYGRVRGTGKVTALANHIEAMADCPIVMLGTGGPRWSIADVGLRL